jgi:hypothetical protein
MNELKLSACNHQTVLRLGKASLNLIDARQDCKSFCVQSTIWQEVAARVDEQLAAANTRVDGARRQ